MPACVRWPATRGDLIFGGCMWAVAVGCLLGAAYCLARVGS